MKVKILQDSITDGADRLTTWELTYPRFVHSEVLTHRVLSRSSASSRAIPTAKLRQMIETNPAIPCHWGAAQKGMQADQEVERKDLAKDLWTVARDSAIADHERMEHLGLHKQVANRILEPWMNITVILSGTEWANFFALRTHKDAEPNFQALAKEMWEQYTNHMPAYLEPGKWHRPLADDLDALDDATKNKIAVGRCARVSYLTHDGVRDVSADIELHDKLLTSQPIHASPAEHVAKAIGDGRMHANFRGWKQYRSFLPGERGPDTSKKCDMCGMWAGSHVTSCSRASRMQRHCTCEECKWLRVKGKKL